jgi:hypothetical protein
MVRIAFPQMQASQQGSRQPYADPDMYKGLARSVTEFGGALQEISERNRAEQERMDDYNLRIGLERFQNAQEAAYREDFEASSPDGSGFLETRNANLKADYDTFRASLKRPEDQARADLAYEQILGRQAAQAFNDVAGKRKGYYANSISEAAEEAARDGFQSDAEAGAAWAKINAQIDASGLDDADKEKLRSGLQENFQEVRFRTMLDQDPYSALAALQGDQFNALPFERKQTLRNVAEAEVKRRDREFTQMEEEAGKAQRAELEREGFDLMLEDKLTKEWLEENESEIGTATYKTLARSLAKRETEKTDEDTYIRLIEQADTEPDAAIAEAKIAYRENRISKDVFKSIMSRAERTTKDETARPWAKDVRAFVRRSLDFGQFMTPAQKERQLNALFAFDDYIAANPKANREEVMKGAKEIVADYRKARAAGARSELRMPQFASKPREGYTLEDIAADRAKLAQKLKAGDITREEAATQAKLLMQWEKALSDVDSKGLPQK